MDLEKLKAFFVRVTPWEVDFRDATIVSKTAYRSIKVVATGVFSIVTIILLTCFTFIYLGYQNKSEDLANVKEYVAKNQKTAEENKKINNQFIEEKNQLFAVFANYNTGFSPIEFLKDLINNKSNKIKFSTIIIQDNKEYSANTEKVHPVFSIQLYGSLKDDVSYLDTYKEDVLTFPTIKHIQSCRSFIQLDQNQKSFNAKEIKFQLTVQSDGQSK